MLLIFEAPLVSHVDYVCAGQSAGAGACAGCKNVTLVMWLRQQTCRSKCVGRELVTFQPGQAAPATSLTRPCFVAVEIGSDFDCNAIQWEYHIIV